MTFRDSPVATPLLWIGHRHLLALDPQTGGRIWDRQTERSPLRVFPFAGAFFVACEGEKKVHVLEQTTGEPERELWVDFEVTAGILADPWLYLAGREGLACIGADRTVAWSVQQVEVRGGLFERTQRNVVGRDARGNEQWRAESPGPFGTNAGLVLGPLMAQPDLDRDT